MKLNLGCGLKHLPGFTNVDRNLACHPDWPVDLERPLPFFDNSAEVVVLDNVLEHIRDFFGLMGELHRVTRPGGIIKIHVPHASCIHAFQDPTHVKFFTLHSMDYLLDGFEYSYYTDIRFRMLSRKLQFTGRRFLFLNVLSGFLNLHPILQDLWERLACWILPMSSITFILEPIK